MIRKMRREINIWMEGYGDKLLSPAYSLIIRVYVSVKDIWKSQMKKFFLAQSQ